MNKTTIVTAAVALALGISACSEQKSLEQLLSSASEHSAKRDFGSAVIELKNAVTLAPKSAQARLALGKAYLEQGYYLSADKELSRSLKLGVEFSQVATLIVHIKLKLNQFEEVYKLVDEAEALNDQDYAVIVTLAGIAAINQNKILQAKDYLSQAVSINETSPYGQLAQAYLAYTNEQNEKGLEITDSLLASTDQVTEAFILQGYLLMSLKRPNEASESFANYLIRHPQASFVKLLEINSLINANKLDSAEAKVEHILKNYQGSPLAKQFKAQISFLKNNFETAIEFSEKAISEGLDYKFTRLLAGVSAFKLDRYELAYRHMSAISATFAEESNLQRLYAFLQLKLGKEDEVLGSIEKFAGFDDIDGTLFAETAMQLARSGNITAAKTLLSKANDLDDSNVINLLREGFLKLRSSDISGVEELEKAIKLDAKANNTWLTIALAHLQNNEMEKALAAAEKWQLVSPVDGWALKGVIYIRANQKDKAFSSLYEALKLDPNHLGAQMNLIKLALRANKKQIALKEAKNILANDAGSMKAMVIIVNILHSEGKLDEAVLFLQSHLAKYPEMIAAKVALAVAYRFDNKPEQSIKLLIQEKSRLMDVGWKVLGDSQLQARKFDEALQTFTQWNKKRPEIYISWIRLIGVLDVLKQRQKAYETTVSAQRVFNNEPQLMQLKLHYEIKQSQVSDAQSTVAIIKKEQLDIPLLPRLEGELALIEQHYDKAEILLKEYYDKAPSIESADFLASALRLNGKIGEAEKLLLQEVNKEKEKVKGLFILADFYSKTQQYQRATESYHQLLNNQPNNVIALNNIALLKSKQNHFPEAIVYARQAVKLAPNYPPVLDTLGWVELNHGERAEGARLLEKAYKLNPHSKKIKEHYEYSQKLNVN
jgi:putative PEP-CTERM system TPR-repeat lipoprotein